MKEESYYDKIRYYLFLAQEGEELEVEDSGTSDGVRKSWIIRRQRISRAKRDIKKTDKFGSIVEYHLLHTPKTHIARGMRVCKDVLERGEGKYVDKAMYRRETGWIRFDFGWEGNPHLDYKGGHGLIHIVNKHGMGSIEKLVNAIAYGEAHRIPNGRKIYFIIGNSFAEVTPLHHGGKRVLTGFDPKGEKYIGKIKKLPKTNCPGESYKGG